MNRTFTPAGTPGRGRTMPVTKRLLLFGCALLVASVGYAQQRELTEKVKLDISSAPLSTVLKALDKQSHYSFSFISEDFDKITVRDFHANNISLGEALAILEKSAGIEFSVRNNAIIFRKAAEKPTVAAEATPITGRVTMAESNEPIPGVSVWQKGTANRVITNEKGEYSLPGGDENATLVFSFVGFETKEIRANDPAVAEVALKSTRESLNEIVVLGYGKAKKGDLSAAVATVPDMDQVKSRPVLNVNAMIQGKVPGVTVISNGGHPNSTPRVVIRGIGSRSSENVLYVVDGVPGAPYNPADIESITVLKDAASAAIYGAFSGSAGVILITTRQAKQGKPGIEYNTFVGMKQAWRTPQSLTATEEAKVSNLAYTNAGLTPLSGWDATVNPYAQVTRTDWVDEVFRTGMIQRHTVSVNAGNEKFSTLLTGRYENEEGTLLNTYNKNVSLRFNANYQFTDKIRLRQDVFFNNNDNRGTETASGYSGVILSAIYMPRSASVYYEDGSFGGVGPRESDYLGIHGDAINPVATLLRNKPYNKSNDLQSVTEVNVADIVKGLSFLSRFSYRQSNSLWKNFEPRRTEPGKPNNQNTLSYSTGKSYHWIWENTLNYERVFGKHNIGAMASMTAQQNGSRSFSAAARGLENEEEWAQFFVNASVFDQNRPGDGESKDRNLSYVGRVAYSWADRYFITGSYRYDIASRLPLDNRGKGLPGVTGAWKISSEPFFHVRGVDLLKVRASWGRIGNLGSIPLAYGYPKLSSNTTYQVGETSPQSTALYMAARNNPNLSWETSEQTDLGIDISLLKNRLSITADYFDKTTFDLITTQTLNWTNTFGYGAPLINQGRISNKGYEVSASWKDMIGKVGYGIGGNFATLKNNVEYIDGNASSAWTDGDVWRGVLNPYRSIVGQPIYSYWLVKSAGIFQTDAEAAAYVDKNGGRIQPEAKAGDIKFIDKDGNGKINDGDRYYMGSAFPKVTYAFNGSVNWNNFDLALFFQGVSGAKLFHAFKQSTLNGAEQGYNRWNKIPGCVVTHQHRFRHSENLRQRPQ
ncbi:SusC/RagA family TonB-linked outer membrane protein [Chitinophaga sedimenti]|uniref:SusC/RagA family TonB-linked outer membrane protein n=1 Tax=Chitinophaga sedimenti TaxID=2033606 RepID=UPI002004FB90|nr:SusC/RagA family TonB-linked outer membrane protein [Chitinophaga sedimenti]MCK7556311.1 SusC/RagA family TonB-linked outer membrane protein [Chitinophaga sedimenti]